MAAHQALFRIVHIDRADIAIEQGIERVGLARDPIGGIRRDPGDQRAQQERGRLALVVVMRRSTTFPAASGPR
jgi:hypothetical protein